MSEHIEVEYTETDSDARAKNTKKEIRKIVAKFVAINLAAFAVGMAAAVVAGKILDDGTPRED